MDNPQQIRSFNINKLFDKEVDITVSDNSDINRSVKIKGIGDIKQLNKEIVSAIARNIGLLFLEKREDGNVCFANNNEEMRDEFKQVFEPADILNYVLGVLNSRGNEMAAEDPMIPMPENSDIFWLKVNAGKHTGL